MGMYSEAKIGYGFLINADGDFPENDYDIEGSMDAYDAWITEYRNSKYQHQLDLYWDCDLQFFGIIIKSCERAEMLPLDIDHLADEIDLKEWVQCLAEFDKFFPQLKNNRLPQFYLMSVMW